MGAWRGLEKAVTDGLVRFIGVSNFHHEKHLQSILDLPGRKYPVYANQIEYHPFVPQYWVDTKEFCEKMGIRVIGYGSMGGLMKDMFKQRLSYSGDGEAETSGYGVTIGEELSQNPGDNHS